MSAVPPTESPYQGLEPFGEADAAFFFGRERETELIVASLFASPLTLLYGGSGVGKSSVLRAGVLRELRRQDDVLPVMFPSLASEARSGAPTIIRGWQEDPVTGISEAVAAALLSLAGEDDEKRRRYGAVVASVEGVRLDVFLRTCADAVERRLMLILDQFEEYSLYQPDDDRFADEFPDVVNAADLSVSVLISLREDALARLDRFKNRVPTLWDSYRRVDRLSRKAAEDAIRLPLAEFNRRQRVGATPIRIEDELVEAVLNDVRAGVVEFAETGAGTVANAAADGDVETPYLQLVMMRLWEVEMLVPSTLLRWTTLKDEGFAPAIVRTHLDRVMNQFSAEEQDLAAAVFHRLVTPSGAKIAFSAADLAEYENVDAAQLTPILRRLEEGNRRILRRVADHTTSAGGAPRYEIFHDRLGKAVLSWRTRRLQEQERNRGQRDEAEQRRVIERARESARESLALAMVRLGPERQDVWSRLMFYLVFTDGRRHPQTVAELANLSQQPIDKVDDVVAELVRIKLLVPAYATSDAPPSYQVVDDSTAAALLEWHSQFVLGKTERARIDAGRKNTSNGPATFGDEASHSFPYSRVVDELRMGRVMPFLGSGVGLSARPQGRPDDRRDKPFLPSHRELKEVLARACDFPPGEFEASDIAEIGSVFVQLLGRAALDALLDDALGRPELEPSATHRVLAELAGQTKSPLIILTTNYDELMERALEQTGTPFDVFAYNDREGHGGWAFQGADGEIRQEYGRKVEITRTSVFRLQGPLLKPHRFGSYVLTEEDQIDWLRRLDNVVPPQLLATLRRGRLLSLGQSGRDWSQRAVLRLLHGVQVEQHWRGWAAALNPSRLSVLTWQRYRVDVYNAELNAWAANMSDVMHARG